MLLPSSSRRILTNHGSGPVDCILEISAVKLAERIVDELLLPWQSKHHHPHRFAQSNRGKIAQDKKQQEAADIQQGFLPEYAFYQDWQERLYPGSLQSFVPDRPEHLDGHCCHYGHRKFNDKAHK